MFDAQLCWINDGHHDEQIARFVFEKDDFVQDLVVGAGYELRVISEEQYKGFPETVTAAERDGDPRPLVTAVKALYTHLRYRRSLEYSFEQAFNPAEGKQWIRGPGEISRRNRGTCIDLTLLFLSCLAQPKLRPIYIHLDRHAMAGVWLVEPPPPLDAQGPILRDLEALLKLIEDGHILVLECTGFSRNYPDHRDRLSFDEARNKAEATLRAAATLPEMPFRFALDVMAAWEEKDLYPDGEIDPDHRLSGVLDEQQFHLRTFVGRRHLLDDLAAWIDRKTEGGYLLLLGPPGQGKSALMAGLARREAERGGCLLHMVKSHPSPGRFLPALISQAARLAQTNFGASAYLGDIDDLREALVNGLKAVVGKVGRAVLVIDALDELDGVGRLPTFLPPALPEGVRVVLTCRPDIPLVQALRARLTGLLEVRSVGPLGDADFEELLRSRLDASALAAVLRQVTVRDVFERAGGNPLYLVGFLNEVEVCWRQAQAGGARFTVNLEQVPRDIEAVFGQVYRRVKEGSEGRQRAALLHLLCEAREPLALEPLSELMAAMGQPLLHGDCQELVEQLSQYLLDVGGRYKPWHQGLTDHILRQVLGKAGRRQVEEVYCRWLATGCGGLYGLRHRISHLLAAGQAREAEKILTDLPELEARAEAGLVFELAGDFVATIRALPPEYDHGGILDLLAEAFRRETDFLARHPTALFQSMWNLCWWYDSPEADRHYTCSGTTTTRTPPWERTRPKVSKLLEHWRETKARGNKDHVWLRSLRPPPVPIGTGLKAIVRGHNLRVSCVCVSKDGLRIITTSDDSTLRVWDANQGAELWRWSGNSSTINCVDAYPDGNWIASGSDDWIVRVWALKRGTNLYCLRGHEGPVWSVAVSLDGKLIASGSCDRTVRIWDAQSGVPLHWLVGHREPVTSVAFSPDTRWLATGSDDRTVRVWDVASRAQILSLRDHEGMVTAVAFSSDGQLLASGSFDGTIRVWDPTNGSALHCLQGHSKPVTSIAFLPECRRIISASHDGTMRLWDLKDETVRVFQSQSGRLFSVSAFPDGRHFASGGDDGRIRVWAAASGGTTLPLQGHEGVITATTFSHNGQRVVSGACDRTVRVWDVTTGIQLHHLPGPEHWVEAVACSLDGRYVASVSNDRTLRVWDLTAQSEPICYPVPQGAKSLALSLDGRLLACGLDDGTVSLWDMTSKAHFLCLRGCQDWVTCLAFSPDSRRIAAGSRDRVPRIWDTQTGTELLHLPEHKAWVCTIAFSADGTRLATGSKDNAVHVWDSDNGARVQSHRGTADAHAVLWGFPTITKQVSGESWEAVVQADGSGRPLAWFPLPLQHITAVSGSRTWAGGFGNYLALFTLEGTPPR